MTAPPSQRKRKILERVQWGASSLLMLAIVVMVNWLAFRHYARWDWTNEGIYTLSDRTKKELAALTVPVEIYLFMSEGEANFPEVKELLDRYRSLTTKLKVEVVDADRDPARYKVLAQRFEVGLAMDVNSGQQFADVAAVVIAGDKKWSITRDDMVGLDTDSLEDEGGPKIDVKAEQALTGAIVQAVSGKATKVCVTEGHGEWTTKSGDQAPRSLWPLADELRRDNVAMESVATLGLTTMPEGCDAVFIVGPVKAFGEAEEALIREYVKAGGNVLLSVDPVIEHDVIVPTGFETLLAEWGVSLDKSVVLELDPQRLLPPGNRAGPFFVGDYGTHRTTEAVKKLGTPWVASIARSVRGMRDGVVMLAQTSKNSYAETSLSELESQKEPTRGPGDIDGPVSVAVAAVPGAISGGPKTNARGGRIVVVGDTDWLRSELMRPDLANRDFMNAILGWLTERETLIAIAPKKIAAQRLSITQDDLGDLMWRLLVFMPAAMIVLGFSTWWARRS